ncbi:HNH endonuclease [Streptomyces sp. NPDC059850]|uniref:HNH endonuclease n=1 Tax=Streptomyces sp. NPDC059850 TaxID=3346970 RepID=UPI0036548AD7
MSHRVHYTRELLAEAAESCSDMDQVIAFFGTRPYGRLRRYLYQRFDHFGIDISHFAPLRRRSTKTRPAGEELRRAVAESTSIAGALRQLNRPDNMRSRALFRLWTAEEGIDTAHFLGQAHQRGKPGTTPRKTPEQILVKHSGQQRTRTVLLRRALSDIGVPERCVECGTGPLWHGRPMTLEVDHINGDWSDDRPENLRLLCPNCHAATNTWCRGGRRAASMRSDRSDVSPLPWSEASGGGATATQQT